MPNFFVYALVAPHTLEVRYIGRSVNPKQRVKAHKGLGDLRCLILERLGSVEEERRKTAEQSRGRLHSEETKAKMSVAAKRRKRGIDGRWF